MLLPGSPVARQSFKEHGNSTSEDEDSTSSSEDGNGTSSSEDEDSTFDSETSNEDNQWNESLGGMFLAAGGTCNSLVFAFLVGDSQESDKDENKLVEQSASGNENGSDIEESACRNNILGDGGQFSNGTPLDENDVFAPVAESEENRGLDKDRDDDALIEVDQQESDLTAEQVATTPVQLGNCDDDIDVLEDGDNDNEEWFDESVFKDQKWESDGGLRIPLKQ